jgi:hypothetical protein
MRVALIGMLVDAELTRALFTDSQVSVESHRDDHKSVMPGLGPEPESVTDQPEGNKSGEGVKHCNQNAGDALFHASHCAADRGACESGDSLLTVPDIQEVRS